MTCRTERFDQIVLEHHGSVCAVAYAILRDRARSEDIAQDAFLIAWQKLPTLSAPPAMPAWICGIARNLARNAARRHTGAAHEVRDVRTPLDEVLDREQADLAARALATIGESEREALTLYYRGSQSLPDVAAALGISHEAAKKRVLRARTRLRAALGPVERMLEASRPVAAAAVACASVVRSRAAEAAGSGAAGPVHAAPPIPAPVPVATYATLATLGAAAAVLMVAAPADALAPIERRVVPTAPVAGTVHPTDLARAETERPDDDEIWHELDDATPVSSLRDAVFHLFAAVASDEVTEAKLTVTGIDPVAAYLPRRVYDLAARSLYKASPPGPIVGNLDKRLVKSVLAVIQPRVLECYLDAFDEVGDADGDLGVTVRLEPEAERGTVTTDVFVDRDSPFGGSEVLQDCMRDALVAMQFPDLVTDDVVAVRTTFTVR